MQWCILRCSSQSTLPLVRSLARAGIEVWTPIEQVTKRVPRANIKRVIEVALIPSYLFVKAEAMPDVLAIMNSPSKDHREFRLFKHNGGVPLIADSTLDALRLIARRSVAKASPPKLTPGDKVKLTEGGFAGLTATIEKPGKEYSSVTLPGLAFQLQVANYHLLQPDTETAIMAA